MSNNDRQSEFIQSNDEKKDDYITNGHPNYLTVSSSSPLPSNESTSLLKTLPSTTSTDRMQLFDMFRRRSQKKGMYSFYSYKKSNLANSNDGSQFHGKYSYHSFEDNSGGVSAFIHGRDIEAEKQISNITTFSTSERGLLTEKYIILNEIIEPMEGLAPLFPYWEMRLCRGKHDIPYRKASPIRSIPTFPPYRRKARHRSFYLWWINEFRHWWKSSRLLVCLGGLYVYSFDPIMAPKVLLLDPTKKKTMEAMLHFSKRLGQGGDQMRLFLSVVKPFTRFTRILVGILRWIEAAPCRRGEVGVEEFMAFIGNRVSRMFARTATDATASYLIFPIQRFLFQKDLLSYPSSYHPISLCVAIGVTRAVTPFAASFQGSRLGRVLTQRFFASSRNRWLSVQDIGELNLRSDDCQEKDEVNQTADLVVIARVVAKALGLAQMNTNKETFREDGRYLKNDALLREGFHQVGSGSGGYAVYQYHFRLGNESPIRSTTVLLHVTPYGPSITDVMPFYTVLEFEQFSSCGNPLRERQWSNFISRRILRNGPPVLKGYCFRGAFFSPHHFAELKETYDEQLLMYESACKKLPQQAKTYRHIGPPRDFATLNKFLELGKSSRQVQKDTHEFDELQHMVSNIAMDLKRMMKSDNVWNRPRCHAPKHVILYLEGLDCSKKFTTGRLVQTALEQAGYKIKTRYYNMPPTSKQRAQPWINRFEVPGLPNLFDLDDVEEEEEHIAVVWNRGPAGDFIYGNFNHLGTFEKHQRYQEFLSFDRECRERNVLFFKLLFVTTRDDIASTLGERLAQKKMVDDLRTWSQSCGSRSENEEEYFTGLGEITARINDADFNAFNDYEQNLQIFCNFALNTDSSSNPWVVVNTDDEYAARKAVMQTFQKHLDNFRPRGCMCSLCCGPKQHPPEYTMGVGMGDMMDSAFRRSWRHSLLAWLTLMGLVLLAYIYAENTKWDDSWFPQPMYYNISELLNSRGNDDDMVVSSGAKTTQDS